MEMQRIKELIYTAIGEASMCWSEAPEGVFDSENAARIGDELIAALTKEEVFDKTTSDSDPVCPRCRAHAKPFICEECYNDLLKVIDNSV
jgi:hypothetical protein